MCSTQTIVACTVKFDSSRIALKTKVRKKKQKVIIHPNLENRNAYQFAIQSIMDVLKADFSDEKFENKEVKTDPLSSFLPNCEGSCATPETNNEPVIND